MSRIKNIRLYLFEVLDELLTTNEYQINANFLDKDIKSYSVDRVPVDPVIRKWINGTTQYQEVYLFRSRELYSQDVLDNLASVGFYEKLEEKINSNNKKGIVPDGTDNIQCLNVGALNIAGTNTSEFSVQIQIQYTEQPNEIGSL